MALPTIRLAAPAALALAFALATAAAAGPGPDTAWTARGLVVAGGPNAQQGPALALASDGGIFVAWEDGRANADTSDLYVQRLLPDGTRAPGWPAGGVAASLAPGSQSVPHAIADGTGGVYVVWEDFRAGAAPRLYAQRLTAAGTRAAGWPADGLRLCTRSGAQREARPVPDGAGGLLVAWEDYRVPQSRIVATRVLGDGTFATGWPDTGRIVAPATGGQVAPAAIPDGAGGAIVAWSDGRGGVTTLTDVYAQRVRGDGTTAPGWPPGGIAVCAAPGAQQRPALAPDGAGGALLAWSDPRSGQFNIYAQRVTAAGAVAPGWLADGISVCIAAPGQFDPVIAGDGLGRSFIAWVDARGGAGNSDLYLQRLEGDGSESLAADGIPLCAAPGDQLVPRIVADGFGGVVLAWQDGRFAPAARLFAHRLTDSGALYPGWPADGRLVADTNLVAEPAVLLASGDGGAYLAWSGAAPPADPQEPDLYAARVRGNGLVPAQAALVAAHARPDRVSLRWWVGAAASPVSVERRDPDGAWGTVAAAVPAPGGLLEWEDREVVPGRRYGYRLSGAEGTAGEAWVNVPFPGLALAARDPGPVAEFAAFRVELPFAGEARLEVFDLAGRRRAAQGIPGPEAGRVVRIGVAALEPGVYRVRLRQEGREARARLVVAR